MLLGTAMRLVCASLTLAAAVAAQPAQFGVQSRLVVVPVTVADQRGRNVESLEPADFIVTDNGRRREVTVDSIATGVAPIALVVAVQCSEISEPVLEKVRKIGAIIQPIVTGDRGVAALLAFSAHVDWVQDFTRDPAVLSRAFASLRAGEPKAGRMLDAVHEAVEKLNKRRNTRRVLLLISESRDRGSEETLDAVVVEAQEAGVTVYSLTYSAFKTAWTTKSSATAKPVPPKHPQKASDVTGTITGTAGGAPVPGSGPGAGVGGTGDILGALQELGRLGNVETTKVLAERTGGTTFPFTRQKALEENLEKFGAELHRQYVLTFTPESDAAPGYHELQVRLARTPGAAVRARPGYWVR